MNEFMKAMLILAGIAVGAFILLIAWAVLIDMPQPSSASMPSVSQAQTPSPSVVASAAEEPSRPAPSQTKDRYVELTEPKTQAGRDRYQALLNNSEWLSKIRAWMDSNSSHIETMNQKASFLSAISIAVDSSPGAGVDELVWTVDCLVLEKGGSTNGCSYSAAMRSQQPYYVSQGELDRINAALARQRQIEDAGKSSDNQRRSSDIYSGDRYATTPIAPSYTQPPRQQYQQFRDMDDPVVTTTYSTAPIAPSEPRYVDRRGREVFGAVPAGPNGYIDPDTNRFQSAYDRGDGIMQTYRKPIDVHNEVGQALESN